MNKEKAEWDYEAQRLRSTWKERLRRQVGQHPVIATVARGPADLGCVGLAVDSPPTRPLAETPETPETVRPTTTSRAASSWRPAWMPGSAISSSTTATTPR
ncbi:hypothetical protein FXW78_39640 [Rhodococcus opacus]|nr:hypothetical protein [Rhodococcus opacus]